MLLLLFVAQLVHVARVTSANWDECHHVYDGYNILTHRDYRLNAEVPPLVKMTAALPLLLMKIGPLPAQDKSQALNAFIGGREFVFGNGGDRVLLPARLMCCLFALALAALVYAVARRVFGEWAGLAALLLFVFDPLVLAHGSLVSTDAASALFLFGSVVAWWRYAQRQTPARFAMAGLVVGLAFSAKFTGILAVPMLVLLAVMEGLRQRRWSVLGWRIAAAMGVLLVGWVVVWSMYGFRYRVAPAGLEISPKTEPYLAGMPNPKDGAKLALVAKYHLLPEGYIWGLANTKYTEQEYTSYFLGKVYRHGPWTYFPVAFLVKSTLPLLLLLVAAPIAWWRSKWKGGWLLPYLAIPLIIYGAVITSSHFDIGARHLMPVYPFLYVVAGGVVAVMLQGGLIWMALAVGLVLWQIVTSVRVMPAYMAYGNEATGGPLQVRRYLSDANVDWGQQLRAVKQYIGANGVTDCWFGYFPDGAVLPSDYGIDCKRLPTPSGTWWMNLPMQVPPVIEGTVFLSESVLDGVESGDGPLNPYAGFQKVKPVAVLQDGVYVYRGRFAVPLAAAWLDVRRSGQMESVGDTTGALQVAQEAVALAPDQAKTQLNLAEMLAKRGAWNEARVHYELAGQWLQANRPELEEEADGPAIRAGLAQARAHVK